MNGVRNVSNQEKVLFWFRVCTSSGTLVSVVPSVSVFLTGLRVQRCTPKRHFHLKRRHHWRTIHKCSGPTKLSLCFSETTSSRPKFVIHHPKIRPAHSSRQTRPHTQSARIRRKTNTVRTRVPVCVVSSTLGQGVTVVPQCLYLLLHSYTSPTTQP